LQPVNCRGLSEHPKRNFRLEKVLESLLEQEENFKLFKAIKLIFLLSQTSDTSNRSDEAFLGG
jgi:hypothetical protein